MKTRKRFFDGAIATLAGIAIGVLAGCERTEDKYLADLEARVAKLEQAIQTGDRAAYDEAEKAVNDFLAFTFKSGSAESKTYNYKFISGEKFKSEAVQTQVAALKARAEETFTSAPAQGEAEFEFKLTEDGNGLVITKYKGTSRHAVIPATIQGLPVKEVANMGNPQVTTIVLSDGIEVIGSNACSGYDGLTTVVLPSTLKVIANRAFEKCTALRTVNFPDSLRAIGLEAFYDTGLEEVTLPEGLVLLCGAAFNSCDKLERITIPADFSIVRLYIEKINGGYDNSDITSYKGDLSGLISGTKINESVVLQKLLKDTTYVFATAAQKAEYHRLLVEFGFERR